MPWGGVDPIVVASQIVLGLQTIASRQIDVTDGARDRHRRQRSRAGIAATSSPTASMMVGTIRTFDPAMRDDIHARMKRTAEHIARAAGATAEVEIATGGLITDNNAALLKQMTPTLQRTAGGGFRTINPITGSEDFPVFTREIPGLFYLLGVSPKGADPRTQPANHSPLFFADEAALPTGVRSMANLAVDYLRSGGMKAASVQ